MTTPERKVSVSLDSDLVEELEASEEAFARLVGGVLTAAGAGSELLAHAVAAAVETGGGLVLTSDVADLERLAAPSPYVQISQV